MRLALEGLRNICFPNYLSRKQRIRAALLVQPAPHQCEHLKKVVYTAMKEVVYTANANLTFAYTLGISGAPNPFNAPNC